MSNTIQIPLFSPQETCDLALKFAKIIAQGDVLLLQGGIGAGKTHFARCLIQSLLDQPEDIPSPTFTLVQTYPTRIGELWHADLYRLSHPDEVFELGLHDAFSDAVCLVEWPDRLGDLAPKQALLINFELSDQPESRMVTLTWKAPRWDVLLKGFTND